MSRTRRKILNGFRPKYMSEGGDAHVDTHDIGHRKMSPYTLKPNEYKFTPDKSMGGDGYMKRVSRTEKLYTKNANRSLKKSLRQHNKQELKELLSTIE